MIYWRCSTVIFTAILNISYSSIIQEWHVSDTCSLVLRYFNDCQNLVGHSLLKKYEPSHDKNQQNDFCAQRRLKSAWAPAQSDQSLRCPHEEILCHQLPIERTAKTLIRFGGCPGGPESSLGAQIILLADSIDWSVCSDAQAYLNFRCMHMFFSEVFFVLPLVYDFI